MKKIFFLGFVLFFLLSFVPGKLFGETLHLATQNWEPFYGDTLPENGFFTALSKEAFKRAGYNIEVKFLPWKRAVEMARRGKYDGILGAFYSDDRANSFYFMDPIAQSDMVFVQREGRGIIYSELAELKQYKVGGTRGDAQVAELRKIGFDIEVTTDDIMNIKKLNLDRVDLIIIGKQYLLYILKNNEEFKDIKPFEILEPSFKSSYLYCPITKKRPDAEEIIKKFNKALQDMKSDERDST